MKFENIVGVFLSGMLFLSSCSPTVRLDTPEPVQIDVNMKVDVTTEAKSAKAEQKPKAKSVDVSPLQRRRLRMAEIQDLKNNRFVGEANNGMLVLKKLPEDAKWIAYVKKLATEENRDRRAIFEQESKDSGKPVDVIAKEFARKMREAAFPNEWVQTETGEWKKN